MDSFIRSPLLSQEPLYKYWACLYSFECIAESKYGNWWKFEFRQVLEMLIHCLHSTFAWSRLKISYFGRCGSCQVRWTIHMSRPCHILLSTYSSLPCSIPCGLVSIQTSLHQGLGRVRWKYSRLCLEHLNHNNIFLKCTLGLGHILRRGLEGLCYIFHGWFLGLHTLYINV